MPVTILEEPIALYRVPDGMSVALEDRCPHRFAPLSRGKVNGANLQCAYHGLEFSSDGACARNPWGDGSIPGAARVRTYPVVERDMVIWVWMGDPLLAQEKDVLDLSAHLHEPKQTAVWGAFRIRAHYEIVADNLLDLSHGAYLHKGTLSNGGEDEIRTSRSRLEQNGNTVTNRIRRDGVRPAPTFSQAWGRRSAA